MSFIPEQPKSASDVPFFDDVTGEDGWQGHTTTKSIETLKSEVIASIGRLGGAVTRFQKGTFQIGELKRDGFQILYNIEALNGDIIPGRLDVAALPVKESYQVRRHSPEATRRDRSLRMALYMLRISIDGLWFLQQLSPGYAPLMPFILADKDKTISQLWAEGPAMSRLLPPGESEFVEGEFVKIKEADRGG